ncbi:MAG TPA: PQQ-binding-like beta-propeller repeat protein [Acidimicrobiales bacterium]|nr:PQQ-binding-like beta-propeller repeat protein [Acidimicrobiales bacterium]
MPRPPAPAEPPAPVRTRSNVPLAVALGVVSVVVAVVVASVWRQPGDAGLTAVWRLTAGAEVISPPAVDGRDAFVATADGVALAVGLSDGRVRWRFEAGERAVGGLVAHAGLAYLVTSAPDGEAGHVFAVDTRTGSERWRLTIDVAPGGPLAIDGTSAFLLAGEVLAVDAVTGEERWRRAVGAGPGMVAAGAGTVVVVTDAGIEALDARAGEQRWERRTPARPEVPPVVVGDVVVTGDGGGAVVGLSTLDGGERWRVATGGLLLQSPASAGGVVVVATTDGALALDVASGSVRWRAGPGGDRTLRVATDGSAVAAVTDGELQVLDARTGARIGVASAPRARHAVAPVVVADGVLLIAGEVVELVPMQ